MKNKAFNIVKICISIISFLLLFLNLGFDDKGSVFNFLINSFVFYFPLGMIFLMFFIVVLLSIIFNILSLKNEKLTNCGTTLFVITCLFLILCCILNKFENYSAILFTLGFLGVICFVIKSIFPKNKLNNVCNKSKLLGISAFTLLFSNVISLMFFLIPIGDNGTILLHNLYLTIGRIVLGGYIFICSMMILLLIYITINSMLYLKNKVSNKNNLLILNLIFDILTLIISWMNSYLFLMIYLIFFLFKYSLLFIFEFILKKAIINN